MEPPGRREIDAAATALVSRHGAQILATARRYAATPEDAEDAYQGGLEILLRKAPTTREYELVPWLKTVVIRTFDLLLCMELDSESLTAAFPRMRERGAG
jgi:DNA-directed RNA polymerase specialized sigma24 family protein